MTIQKLDQSYLTPLSRKKLKIYFRIKKVLTAFTGTLGGTDWSELLNTLAAVDEAAAEGEPARGAENWRDGGHFQSKNFENSVFELLRIYIWRFFALYDVTVSYMTS